MKLWRSFTLSPVVVAGLSCSEPGMPPPPLGALSSRSSGQFSWTGKRFVDTHSHDYHQQQQDCENTAQCDCGGQKHKLTIPAKHNKQALSNAFTAIMGLNLIVK